MNRQKSDQDQINYSLVAANEKDHERILDNLLSLYLYDLSEFFEINTDQNGRFIYRYHWDSPNTYPFLAYQDSLPVGFALVEKGSAIGSGYDVWDMEEFFILRAYRRRGAGIWLAHQMYRKFHGKWEIRVGEKNTGALAFWRNSLTGVECSGPEESFIQGDLGMFHCISTTITS